MSFIDIPDLDDLPELEALPAGEYQLRLVKAELRQQDPSKGTSQFLLLTFSVVSDNPNVKDLSHVLMLPDSTKDEKENNNRKRRLKSFLSAFNLSMPLNAEDLGGETGFAILSLENSDEYGDQNRIKKFVTGA